jgi:predicted protein tyrosine phosphatase
MRILLLCSQNKLRSPTAEQVFANTPGVECSAAGPNHDAENPLTAQALRWAELIVVMAKAQPRRLSKRFRAPLAHARVVCLDILDDYAFMQPALGPLLKTRMAGHLPRR